MKLKCSQPIELEGYSTTQRLTILQIALQQLTPSKQVLLRCLKLALFTPCFLAIALIEGWLIFPVLLLTGLCYPIFTKPLEGIFVKPHLQEAIKIYQQQKKQHQPNN